MPYWFDGNNLIGRPAATAREDHAARRAFLALLSRHHTSRGGRFLVFFDGDDPDRTVTQRGVTVRFSAPLSADDAILKSLRGVRFPGEVIVVSNDHELKRRCRDAGARVMDWAEFTDRMRASRGTGARSPEHEESVSVDEWIDYFGLDEEALE